MVAGYGKDGACSAKLSFLSDKAGKTRVVAMLDSWSQAALEPIHKHFMKCLRLIPTDYTLNQGAGRKAVQEVSKLGIKMFSFDLKAATDRLPKELAFMACSDILGADLAES
jgi:hypothetical protein